MNLLATHVLRAMGLIRLRLLVIALICASTFGVLVGAYSAIDSLFQTVEQSQTEAHMADLELLFATDDRKNVPDFNRIAGVESTALRLLVSGRLEWRQSQTASALFVGAPLAQFAQHNRLRLLRGLMPQELDPHGVVLERNCARHYQLEPGDELSLQVGKARYALMVRGIVESPEYLVAPLNPGVYVPTSGSLCVLFGNQALLQDALGFPAVNSLLVHFAPGASPAALKNALLERAQSRLTVDYALLRSEQFSQKFLELDLNTFKVFLPTVVLIFALSSTLVVFFLMFQWIKEERPRIAMLLVLGYSHRRVLMAYLLPAFLIVALSIALGLCLGWADMWAFGVNYANAIGLPEPVLQLQPLQIALAICTTLATVAGGMFLPLRSLLRVNPIEALRDNPGADSDRFAASLVRRMKALGGPFWLQYALRNLARSWAVTLVSTLAIAASLAVTIAFYISLTSMERTALGSFAADQWQAVVDLDTPQWNDEINRLEQAIAGSRWSTFVKGGAQIASPHRLDNAYLIGVDPQDAVRNPQLLDGRMLQTDDHEAVVIERRLAVDHGLSVGGTITLKVRGESTQAQVVGILSGAVPGEVITTRHFAQRLLSVQDQFTGAFLIEPALGPAGRAALLRTRDVLRVTSKAEINSAILSISGHIWTIIHLSALMSIGVSALFLLTSISFTIMGRRGEYGMLRILGYTNATVARVVLTEAMLMAVLAALIAAPLGWLLGNLLNSQLTEVWFKINTAPAASDFLRILLPSLFFVPFAVWPAMRGIFRLPAVETLKQRKFG